MLIDKRFSKISKFHIKLNVFFNSSDSSSNYTCSSWKYLFLFKHIGGLSFPGACVCLFLMTERQSKNPLLGTLKHIFLSADRVCNSTATEEKKQYEMMDGIYFSGNENSLGVCVYWLLCK